MEGHPLARQGSASLLGATATHANADDEPAGGEGGALGGTCPVLEPGGALGGAAASKAATGKKGGEGGGSRGSTARPKAVAGDSGDEVDVLG